MDIGLFRVCLCHRCRTLLCENDDISAGDDNRIDISEAHTDRLIAMWEKQSLRPSIQRELKGLIAQQVHEEILYREVLGKALDKGDTVIRRQLASDRSWPYSEAR